MCGMRLGWECWMALSHLVTDLLARRVDLFWLAHEFQFRARLPGSLGVRVREDMSRKCQHTAQLATGT